jgi:predicted ArsR family transcriptional regulator
MADDPPLADRVAAVAALDEPTRRRLYEYVVRQALPVGRDEAADACGVSRSMVAFHLDKLVEEDLLEVTFRRRTGRTGPGAGRPSKLYQRSGRRVAVSLPERQHELAGHLLAAALEQSDTAAESPRTVLNRNAFRYGHDLGHRYGDAPLAHVLEEQGFEPRTEDGETVLVNCPFHELAQRHTDLVCGMNLHLLRGLLAGLEADAVQAQLVPTPNRCCVRIGPA